MADKNVKVFTVQPRFKMGDSPSGWSMVDGIFQFGDKVPPYGTEFRDAYLAVAWFGEPMLAGALNTWIERVQTVNWKVTGGKVNATSYARMFQNADKGAGWSRHEGMCALDYLATDKGSMEELGRAALDDHSVTEKLREYFRQTLYDQKSIRPGTEHNYAELDRIIAKATTGKVTSIQHLDSSRMIKYGLPGMRWRYYPEYREPIYVPDENIVQLTSMPTGRDRYRGYGHCAVTRLIDAMQLMLGYLTYLRQEIGDIPPEMAVIINGLSATAVEDSLRKYKKDKKAAGNDTYGKMWWLGSDDPMTPVDFKTVSLLTPNKNFSYTTMTEWWAKTLALELGVDVGELWLLQKGESKTVQSVQAEKSRGKGVAKYLQEKERLYNMKILPYGTRFEYDNPDDEQDRARNDILATKIGNLEKLAKIGVDREDPLYSIEELRKLADYWDIIPPEMSDEEIPTVIGAMLKEIAGDDTWVVTSAKEMRKVQPLLKDVEREKAMLVYKQLEHIFSPNGHMLHQTVNDLQEVSM